jgi:hypothetical protein
LAVEVRTIRLLSISNCFKQKSTTSPDESCGLRSAGSSKLAENSFLTVTIEVYTASYREARERFFTLGKYST